MLIEFSIYLCSVFPLEMKRKRKLHFNKIEKRMMAEHGKDASQRVELRERIITAATEAFTSKGIKSITNRNDEKTGVIYNLFMLGYRWFCSGKRGFISGLFFLYF